MADKPAQPVGERHTYLRLRCDCVPEPGDAASNGGSLRAARPLDAPIARRVLGKALIERFCPFGQPLCEELKGLATPLERCALAQACPYGLLFAASLTARPPFALYVPVSPARGQTVLELTLFGPAVSLFAWTVDAVVRALASGIGSRRVPYRVVSVTRLHADGSATQLSAGSAAMAPRLVPDSLPLCEAIDPHSPVLVEFLSPTRLTVDGRLLMGGGAPPLAIVVARILDRFRDLFGEEALGARAWRRGIVALAQSVDVVVDEVEWMEVDDYSARTGREMSLDGKVGRALFGAGAGAFLPILRLGEVLHLGKNAASGCGRIRASVAGP